MSDQNRRDHGPGKGIRLSIYRATRGRINLGPTRSAAEFHSIFDTRHEISNDELRRDSFDIAVVATAGGCGSSVVSAGIAACLNRLPEFQSATAVVNYSPNPWTTMSPFLTAASAEPLELLCGPSFHTIVEYEKNRPAGSRGIGGRIRSSQFCSMTAYGLHVYNRRPARFGVPRLSEEDIRLAEAVIRPHFASVVNDCGTETDPVAASAARSARIVIVVCPPNANAARLAACKLADMKEFGISPERTLVVINDRYRTFSPRWRARRNRRVKATVHNELQKFASIASDQIVHLPYEPRFTRFWRNRIRRDEMGGLRYENRRDFPVEQPHYLSKRMRRALMLLTATCLDQMFDKSEITARAILETAGQQAK